MKPALCIRHLHLSYGNQRVLNDVSLAVNEGEFFIIIGPNGSGKTSLVKAASGAVRPQSGEVEVFEHQIRRFSGRALARIVAVVPQTAPVDVPFTVADVVLMGRSPHLPWLGLERQKDREIAQRAMHFTKVDHLATRKLNALSAGERQRVLIARAVAQQPRLMVLDEPTSALDLAHQVQIMDLMEQLRDNEGTTVVMVSHDLNLAALYADRLLLMKEGSVVSVGKPAQVLTFDSLEQTFGCVLLVDENPLKEVPRVTLVPKKLVKADYSKR